MGKNIRIEIPVVKKKNVKKGRKKKPLHEYVKCPLCRREKKKKKVVLPIMSRERKMVVIRFD